METPCAQLGLKTNPGKTKYILINQLGNIISIIAMEGDVLDKVEDYKYLASWVCKTAKDINNSRVCTGVWVRDSDCNKTSNNLAGITQECFESHLTFNGSNIWPTENYMVECVKSPKNKK